MTNKKRCIAIIPARSGSKRIKNKNIKKFLKKPILYYPVKTAIKSGCFDEVYVSTNSIKIAKLAISYGAKVPYLRSKKLSNDVASTISVISDFIKFLKKKKKNYDFICCIYPTSVFLKKSHLLNALKKLKNNKTNYVVSVTEFTQPIERSFEIKNDLIYKSMKKKYFFSNSNNFKKKYHDAAQFYFGKSLSFEKKKPVLSKGSSIIVIKKYHSIDINSDSDWKMAELIYKNFH